MRAGRPKFYWDAAPLIAWIKDEKRQDPGEMSGLADVIEMADEGEAIIMTSVLWRAEVLTESMTAGQKRRLLEAFNGRSMIELQIDSRVMDLAAEIRINQQKSPKKDVIKQIRIPDAIHLASAIHYGATEFHTFDGAKQSGNIGKLLTLSGNVAGYPLKICTPKADQFRLHFPSVNHPGEAED